MSSVLYYSQYCQNCSTLLQTLSKSSVKDDMHFICIDKRTKDDKGQTFIILQNGQKVILPPTITKVPALLLLNKNHHVLFGTQINDYLRPEVRNNTKQTVSQDIEPQAFSLGGGSLGTSMTGVMSDMYSYLDQSSDELNPEKGSGGIRQMHNYVTHDSRDNIETPPDTWSPNKIDSNMSMEQIMEAREKDMPKQQRPDI
jgi:hypothetical protein